MRFLYVSIFTFLFTYALFAQNLQAPIPPQAPTIQQKEKEKETIIEEKTREYKRILYWNGRNYEYRYAPINSTSTISSPTYYFSQRMSTSGYQTYQPSIQQNYSTYCPT